MPEAIWFESRCHSWRFEHSVVAIFGFCRGNITNRLQQPAMVEPVDPYQGGELDGWGTRFVMAPSSQELEPPGNPGRFTQSIPPAVKP